MTMAMFIEKSSKQLLKELRDEKNNFIVSPQSI